jgi:hypothetical protein
LQASLIGQLEFARLIRLRRQRKEKAIAVIDGESGYDVDNDSLKAVDTTKIRR